MFVGGNFWDGRATGEKLGNPATDQAQGLERVNYFATPDGIHSVYGRTTVRLKVEQNQLLSVVDRFSCGLIGPEGS